MSEQERDVWCHALKPFRFAACHVAAAAMRCVTAVAETPVASLDDLQKALAEARPGDTVRTAEGSVIALKDTQVTVPGKVTLAGDEASITASSVSKAIPDYSLANGAELPASPFRTDDWPMATK